MAGRNGTTRAERLESVVEDRQKKWLAEEIDYVERKVLQDLAELSAALTANTKALGETREQMQGNANRVLAAVLAASLSLVVGVILAVTLG